MDQFLTAGRFDTKISILASLVAEIFGLVTTDYRQTTTTDNIHLDL